MSLAPELPDGPVTNAANTLLQTGVLGSMCVLLIIGIVWLVLRWNKTNELRVKDQKEASATIREMTEAHAELVTSIKEALGELVGTTNALKEALKANTEASKTMERTINETVREAIRSAGYRRYATPSAGTSGGPPPAAGRGG